MIYAGLDLHKRFSFVTAVNAEGKILGQRKLPSNGEVVESLKGFDEPREVAIEANPSWCWLYDLLSLSYLPEKQVKLNRELLRYRAQQAIAS